MEENTMKKEQHAKETLRQAADHAPEHAFRPRPSHAQEHPMDNLLRVERIPHIWCPGCGIGTVFSSVIAAIQKSSWDLDKIAMVSGIGCTGRMAGYIRLDSYHTTHGRALPFATGLKLAKPDTKILVASGDGDLFAIGGNHFHPCGPAKC